MYIISGEYMMWREGGGKEVEREGQRERERERERGRVSEKEREREGRVIAYQLIRDISANPPTAKSHDLLTISTTHTPTHTHTHKGMGERVF